MRIISWNMQHKKASWHFLHQRHGDADVALLQEACTPPREVALQAGGRSRPWKHRGWNGARAVVGVSGRVDVDRVPVLDIIESAAPDPVIRSKAGLASRFCHTPREERIALVSIESAGKATERVPRMVLEIQRHCGTDLSYIVGADLTTWWDSDTTVFGDMMRIGLPLIGLMPPRSTTLSMDRNRPMPIFNSTTCSRRGQLPTDFSVQALNGPCRLGPRVIIAG